MVFISKDNDYLEKNISDDKSDLLWLKILKTLKKFYGNDVFENWISHISLVCLNYNTIKLSVPTKFIKEWITNNYVSTMLEICKEEEPSIRFIEIEISRKSKKRSVTESYKQESVAGQCIKGQNIAILEENKEEYSSNLDRRLTFENFVLGDSNKFAFAASKDFSKQKSLANNNVLYIYSGVGLGKTHLLHSIAWEIKSCNPGKKVVYMSAEKFMIQFVNALRNKKIMQFKENFRHIDVLLIDDLHFVCGKESTQEEFCHTFNSLIDQKKQVVMSCNESPYKLEGIKEHIRSRLSGGLVVDIGKPSFELRVDILKSKAKLMGFSDISVEVLEFIASNMFSNIRELEGALNKVIVHSALIKNKITLPWLESIFSDVLSARDRVLTISDIKNRVAKYYSIKLSDISSASRARAFARPRQVAMFLCKELTCRSLTEIGNKFGKRDHATVIYSVKNIKKLCSEDFELNKEVEDLISLLKKNSCN